jgi:hypothetical protein
MSNFRRKDVRRQFFIKSQHNQATVVKTNAQMSGAKIYTLVIFSCKFRKQSSIKLKNGADFLLVYNLEWKS